jgi:glyoxylase-like metal-dependent hydrolase (beta-lactamase superfamily II)
MMKRIAMIAACFATSAVANEDIADQYPNSLLYSAPVEFIPGVFSAIGATAPPTYENAGHNNNLSFIVTGEGVVVVNGGGSFGLAEALHEEIKARTDQPVVLVIDENGQGHAMLGNSYWATQDVPIIAHVDAAAEFEERGFRILENAERMNRDRHAGTVLQGPTETFDDEYILELGEYRIEVRYLGPSHSAGDVVVWLPNQSLVIAGDMAFHERMLPIFEDTYTLDWLETWDAEFEALEATYVIPGHGHPTNMDQVRLYTKGYLEYLRGEVGALIDNGDGLAEAYYVDQTPYLHLDTFEELATKNAGRVYEQMEFE